MTTLAYMAAKKDKRANSATFFTTMLDFSEPGELGVFLDEGAVAGLEKKMDERGFLEGSEMAGTFNMLRANDLIWSFVVNNYLMGKDPFPFDLLYWNSDSTRMPAAMHSFYLRNMYLEQPAQGTGRHHARRRQDRPRQGQDPVLLHLDDRRPHRAVEEHLHGRPPAVRRRPSSCSAAPATSPASSIRRSPTSMASGPMTRPTATCRKIRKSSWPAPRRMPVRGGRTGTQWVTSLPGGSAKVKARKPEDGTLKVIEDAPGSYVKFRLDTQKKS